MKKMWVKPELMSTLNQNELCSEVAIGDWLQWVQWIRWRQIWLEAR